MNERIDLKNIDHICIMVKDVEKTAERIASIFDIPKINLIECTSIASLEGRDSGKYKARAAMIQISGNLKLEIGQIVEGKSIEEKWVKEHDETIHHIGIPTENLDEEVLKWKKKGVRVIQEDHGSWVYLDTERILGTIVELYKPGVQEMFL